MQAYTAEEAAAKVAAELPGWSVDNGTLYRKYTTKGWGVTLMLVNSLGFLAEAANHHPDLTIGYKTVEVRLSTHDAGGITDKDFALAREFATLASWRPTSDSALAPGKGDDWVA